MSAGKRLIFDAFLLALETAEDANGLALLTDEEYGAPILTEAREHDLTFAVTIEASGRAELEFEYGDRFGEHIERFEPSYGKVLVRHNVEGAPSANARQTDRLAALSEWLHGRPTQLLLEVVVPATADQLASVDGDRGRYDRELKPALMLAAIEHFQRAGIEPDVWKLEGLDKTDQTQAIATAACAGGREHVGCIVLGAGEDDAAVTRWLQAAAPVEGYRGFAVGRTIWAPQLQSYLRGERTASAVAEDIAASFLRLVALYRNAAVRAVEAH
jgi:myo-inositol catabolism protein IolC